MITPTSTEIACMRSAAAELMLDTCQIGTPTQSGSEPGQTYTYGSSVSCGINYKPKGEAATQGGATVADAEIRLPYDTTLTGKDRIRLTYRLGTELNTPEVYAVLGEPKKGMLGLFCMCQRLTGGSVK